MLNRFISYLRDVKRERHRKSLIRRGLTIGTNVYLNDGYFIDPSHCELISIGNNVTFGPGVVVLAHDASSKKLIGKTVFGEVRIGDGVFVGARAVVLPSVTIGNNSVIAAGAVLTRAVPADEVWAGVPAKFLMSTDEYRRRLLEREGVK